MQAKMSKFTVLQLAFAVGSACVVNAHAMSNSDYIRLTSDSSSKSNRTNATIYIHGVHMGFMVSSIAGKDKNICFPPKLSIEDYDHVNLVKSEMEQDKTIDGDYPVALTLFHAFKRKFPCKP